MKLLVVSDVTEAGLWDYYSQEKTEGVELILSCGDLPQSYLEFLVTMVNRPLLYVRGNHDERYHQFPPGGCVCIEDQLVTVNGIRIAGLGGSMRYKNSTEMYTEDAMRRRVQKLSRKIRMAGGIDILLTHAPVRGYGDGTDTAHRGFECFRELLDTYQPAYHFYGHMHQSYGNYRRYRTYGPTTLVNACGHVILDYPKLPQI